MKCFKTLIKITSIGVFEEKNPTNHELKSRGIKHVMAVVLEFTQKNSVLVFFCFKTQTKTKRICQQKNHSLSLHSMLQDPFQASTANS